MHDSLNLNQLISGTALVTPAQMIYLGFTILVTAMVTKSEGRPCQGCGPCKNGSGHVQPIR